MDLPSARGAGNFARSRPVIDCAQCGASLYVPEWTEFHESGSVRHLWHCEMCDYSFETTVHYAAA